MKKEMLAKIMKRAWEIKKEDADYVFGECLRMAWNESKNGSKGGSIEEYLLGKGYKVWEKGSYRRIYMNTLSAVADEETTKLLSRKTSMYYDVNRDVFCYNTTPSREDTLKKLIKSIREAA